MLGDLYQADTDSALNDLAAKAPEPPKPVAKWNGWSAPLRGGAAGSSESAAFVADSVKGYGEIMGATGTQSAGGMFSLQSEKERRDTELQRIKNDQAIDTTSEIGTGLRNVARDYRPDPATAGLAERLAFDLTRFLGKAVGYTVAGGGVPGAVALGADEAMVTADDLGRQGVDQQTRMKAGAVAGVAAAAGVVLPVAAPGSVAKTVGLWALGGPGAFISQQQATREILGQADYKQLAEQYDPLDPVGLLVSSLVPAGFAAHALHGARVKAAPGAKPAPEAPPAAAPALTPDQVDAVMAHNLTLARDVHEATPVPDALPAKAVDRSTIPDIAPPDAIQPIPRLTGEQLIGKTYAELDAMHTSAVDHNRAVDIEGIRKFFGDEQANVAETWGKRQLENWLMKNETDQSSEWMQSRYINDELIAEHRNAINNFDPQGPVELGRSIAVIARNVDKPGFFDSADGASVSGAMQYARDQGWNLDEVLQGMRARAAEWAGNDAPELFNRLFKRATERPQALAAPETASNQGVKQEVSAPTLTADHLTNTPAAPPNPSADPLLASIAERIARVEQMAPDMVVRTDDAGQPVTVAKEMARIREESRNGSDMDLGADDAHLLTVAANCAIGG